MSNIALAVDGYDVPGVGESLDRLVITESVDSLQPAVTLSINDWFGLLTFGYEMTGAEKLTLAIADDEITTTYELRLIQFLPEDTFITMVATPTGHFKLATDPKAKSYRGTPDFVVDQIAEETGLKTDAETLAPYNIWIRPSWTGAKMMRYLRRRAYSRQFRAGGVLIFGRFPDVLVAQHVRTAFVKPKPYLYYGGEGQIGILRLNGLEVNYGRSAYDGFAGKGVWWDMRTGAMVSQEGALAATGLHGYRLVRQEERRRQPIRSFGRADVGNEMEKALSTHTHERNLAFLETASITVPFNLGLHAGLAVETEVRVDADVYHMATGRWLITRLKHSLIPTPETVLHLARGIVPNVERTDLHVRA